MPNRRPVSPPSPASPRGHYWSSLGPDYVDIDLNPSLTEPPSPPRLYDIQDQQDSIAQWGDELSLATEHAVEPRQPGQPKHTREYSACFPSDQCYEDSDDHNKPGVISAHQSFVNTGLGYETIIADILCIGLPATLLVFVVILSSKSGLESTTSHIKKWQDAASVLSTLFPLLFAAITGRFMTQFARWKLEEGVSIGTLEQLLGSRTVGGAVLTQYHLRAFNFLGVGIILLWALSPLGAQAILRLVEPHLPGVTTYPRVLYFDLLRNDAGSQLTSPGTVADIENNRTINVMNTLYGAMILSPSSAKNSSMDLWGNVKIPRLPTQNTGDWQDITQESQVVYSSLLGVPVMRIPIGSTTFSIESSYIDLQCDQLDVWDSSAWEGEAILIPPSNTSEGYLNSTYLYSLNEDVIELPQIENGSFQGYHVNQGMGEEQTFWSIGLDRFIDQDWRTWNTNANSPLDFANETGIEVGPTRLMFHAYQVGSLSSTTTELVGMYCDVKQRYVESKIVCEKAGRSVGQNCTTISQRQSERYKLDENLNILNWPYTFRFLTVYWPRSIGPRTRSFFHGLSDEDILFQYLFDPTMDNLSRVRQAGSISLALQNISATDLSVRLSQALNTYLQLGAMRYMAFNTPNTTDFRVSDVVMAEATGETAQQKIGFGIAHVWSTFSMIACITLLAGGIASSVFAHLTIGPEILGYATSFLRKTTLELPAGKEGLEGMELSFELRKRRVRYGFGPSEAGVPVVGDQETIMKMKDELKSLMI